MLASLLACWVPGIMRAQEPPPWLSLQFTSQNGLPQNSVIDLAMDAEGYLWLTTEGGLVRYDGDRFESVSLPRLHENPMDRFRGIIQVADGSLLISNTIGDRYCLFNGQVLQTWTADNFHVREHFVDGVLPYAALSERLTDRRDTLRGGHLLDPRKGYRIQAGTGGHWTAAGEQALLHYERDSLLAVVRYDRELSRFFHLDGVWYGVDRSGPLFAIDPVTGRTRPVEVAHDPGIDPAAVFLKGRQKQHGNRDHTLIVQDRHLFMVSHGVDGKHVIMERLPLELPDRCLINTWLWSPRHRVLFVGTDTKGLFVYRERAIRTLVCDPVPEGGNQAYYALHALGPDSIVAFSNAYRTLFTRTGCSNVIERGSIAINYQFALGLENGHLLVARHDRVIDLDPRTGIEQDIGRLPDGLITAICRVGDSLVVGDMLGIGVLREGRYRRMTGHVGGTNAFTVIDDVVWAATCAGVLRFHADGRSDTLSQFEGSCVRVIRKVDGLVLIGTYGSGAYVMVDGRPKRLPMDRQGFLTHVHAFALDGKGMLWMSTNRGLFRMAMADLHTWLHDPSHHVYYAYYGVDDGIRNAELNGGCDPPFLELGNGHLAFPSLEGVVAFDPTSLPDPVPSGLVRITELHLDGAPMTVGGDLVLPPDHGELRVKLSLPYWGSPVNAHLEYRIKGMQADWSALGIKERELRFARFQPGEYELQVRVLGAVTDRAPTLLRFRVEAPLHRRWWFLALSGVGTGLLLLTLLRLNERRLRRRNEELEQAVRERTQELQRANEQLHRSVELKERLVSIISHDIVTPLRFIARVARSMRGRVSVVDEDLRDIAASSDKLHANARNILNWIKHQGGHIELRPRHVAMNPLVEEVLDTMREPAAGQGVTLHNEVPMDDVVRTDRDVVLIILQNIVANAVNYAPNGTVTVHGVQVGDRYLLRVADTGRGISPKALDHVRDILHGEHGRRGMDHGDPEMQGLGYVIIGELTSLLGGSVELEIGDGGGTVVTLALPTMAAATPHPF
ncbi:MAG: hypothetical protein JNL05_08960 [Flavobacteriales bacterium]|nr:hypothetical protein [Flavobacteriales bacterium]